MSFFTDVVEAAPIEVFHMDELFSQDPSPNKVNLSIGAYRTEEGRPWVLPVVRNAEVALANDLSLDHEYLPLLGHEQFCRAATELVLGEDSPAIVEGRAIGVQCLSGTGSLRLGAEFLHTKCEMDTVYLSRPTWGNHILVFQTAGFEEFREYAYWDENNNGIDIEGMIGDLEQAPERSVILLQGCAHNPTGMDPTREQWRRICDVVKRRRLFTFFDIANQGLSSGDPDADAWAIRYFVSQRVELLVAQSFAKNFGLYNDRVGNLTIVVNDKTTIAGIKSQATLCSVGNYSNPPAHGALIVYKILTTRELREEWLDSLKVMVARHKDVRTALKEQLDCLSTPRSCWSHITQQTGMYCYARLTPEQCDRLIEEHKVYLLRDGRAALCGLNSSNVEYVARAIDDVIRSSAN